MLQIHSPQTGLCQKKKQNRKNTFYTFRCGGGETPKQGIDGINLNQFEKKQINIINEITENTEIYQIYWNTECSASKIHYMNIYEYLYILNILYILYDLYVIKMIKRIKCINDQCGIYGLCRRCRCTTPSTPLGSPDTSDTNIGHFTNQKQQI